MAKTKQKRNNRTVRDYHRLDIAEFLKVPSKAIENPYRESFQVWFQSGLRRCIAHPYVVEWHVATSTFCPKCTEQLGERPEYDRL